MRAQPKHGWADTAAFGASYYTAVQSTGKLMSGYFVNKSVLKVILV